MTKRIGRIAVICAPDWREFPVPNPTDELNRCAEGRGRESWGKFGTPTVIKHRRAAEVPLDYGCYDNPPSKIHR